MRTFTRAELGAAWAAWDNGDFSDEWRDVRHRAALGGLIYPPSGTKWDSWDDDNPSQRAMIIRAIRESPVMLDRCVIGAKSWSDVIERLMKRRDDWREEQAERERAAAREREDEPTPRQAVMSIRQIFDRITDS
ncbi:MAG: hypothetical protein H0W36_00580 [Gemmatimonadetes bacterium]|nr:hypothetical protein [Gemmatimonadota bacterium]